MSEGLPTPEEPADAEIVEEGKFKKWMDYLKQRGDELDEVAAEKFKKAGTFVRKHWLISSAVVASALLAGGQIVTRELGENDGGKVPAAATPFEKEKGGKPAFRPADKMPDMVLPSWGGWKDQLPEEVIPSSKSSGKDELPGEVSSSGKSESSGESSADSLPSEIKMAKKERTVKSVVPNSTVVQLPDGNYVIDIGYPNAFKVGPEVKNEIWDVFNYYNHNIIGRFASRGKNRQMAEKVAKGLTEEMEHKMKKIIISQGEKVEKENVPEAIKKVQEKREKLKKKH